LAAPDCTPLMRIKGRNTRGSNRVLLLHMNTLFLNCFLVFTIDNDDDYYDGDD